MCSYFYVKLHAERGFFFFFQKNARLEAVQLFWIAILMLSHDSCWQRQHQLQQCKNNSQLICIRDRLQQSVVGSRHCIYKETNLLLHTQSEIPVQGLVGGHCSLWGECVGIGKFVLKTTCIYLYNMQMLNYQPSEQDNSIEPIVPQNSQSSKNTCSETEWQLPNCL